MDGIEINCVLEVLFDVTLSVMMMIDEVERNFDDIAVKNQVRREIVLITELFARVLELIERNVLTTAAAASITH